MNDVYFVVTSSVDSGIRFQTLTKEQLQQFMAKLPVDYGEVQIHASIPPQQNGYFQTGGEQVDMVIIKGQIIVPEAHDEVVTRYRIP